MSRDLDYSDIGSYLVSISKRIAALEVDFEEMLFDIESRSKNVTETASGFKAEIGKLRSDMNAIRWEASDLSKSVDKAIQYFNKTLRKSKFERLVRRVEAFSPEELATHKAMDRAFKELTSDS